MTENIPNHPIVNQRCFCAGIGFGTIREIRGNRLRIRFDADTGWKNWDEEKTRWKLLEEVELVDLPPAARMQDTGPLAPNYNDPLDFIEWY